MSVIQHGTRAKPDSVTASDPGLAELAEQETAFCFAHGIQLSVASGIGWLVRETHPTHTGTVLGCIDREENNFELMELSGGFRWFSFLSLRAALTQLLHDLPQPGDERLFDPKSDTPSGLAAF